MRKITLFMIGGFMTSVSFGQTLGSDDPIYLNTGAGGGPSVATTATKSVSVSGTVAPCDGGPTTLSLSGSSCGSYTWYDDSIGTTALATDMDLTTGTLTSDTTFYLQSTAPISPTDMALPAHSSTFTGNVRGYWFQAPSDFYITGFVVPTDASSGTSNVALVRFNSGAPPLYSTTTNDFTLLEYWANSSLDTLTTCVQVNTGDFIGVLGNRADANSYASAPYATTIDGNAVTLTRLGMQLNLSTNAPANLFQEASGSLSRVHMLYSTTLSPGTIDPINVIVPSSFSGNVPATICDNDSIMIAGQYQTTAGIYPDTLTTAYGCDSIINVNLSVGQSYFLGDTVAICPGDSVELGGMYYDTPGVYPGYLSSSLGCDSTVFLTVQHNIVDISTSVAGITISAASAGTYTWVDCNSGYSPITGETGQSYTPTANGSYAVIINDGICIDTSDCVEITTVGLPEMFEASIHIAPNPTSGEITIDLGEIRNVSIEVKTIRGRVVSSDRFDQTEQAVININEPAGYYFVTIRDQQDQQATFKVVKQ